MKHICLLRHAKAKREAASDFERPLSKRGRKDAKAMGEWLAASPFAPQFALCSPAARTQQTLERVRKSCALVDEPRLLQSLYGAVPSTFLARMRAAPASIDTLLVIGHNPGIANCAARLASPESDQATLEAMQAKFPAAAVAVFSADIDSWRELQWSGARLLHFMRPADLD